MKYIQISLEIERAGPTKQYKTKKNIKKQKHLNPQKEMQSGEGSPFPIIQISLPEIAIPSKKHINSCLFQTWFRI